MPDQAGRLCLSLDTTSQSQGAGVPQAEAAGGSSCLHPEKGGASQCMGWGQAMMSTESQGGLNFLQREACVWLAGRPDQGTISKIITQKATLKDRKWVSRRWWSQRAQGRWSAEHRPQPRPLPHVAWGKSHPL